MRTKELDSNLRQAINEFLSKNYCTQLPADKTYVIDERNEYIYMDTENENVFYIPKHKITIKSNDVPNIGGDTGGSGDKGN